MTLRTTLRQFKALSDPTRLRMLLILTQVTEVCSCDFADLFGFSAPTISRHTSILYEADLISCRKDGRWVFFSINEKSRETLEIMKLLQKFGLKSEIEEDVLKITNCTQCREKKCCKK